MQYHTPPDVAVTCHAEALRQQAMALAASLHLPWVEPTDTTGHEVRLCLEPTGLELRLLHDPCLKGPVRCHFVPPARGNMRHPLLQAAGLKRHQRPSVLDCTAGLGRDAFRLAAAGCLITMMERNPLMAALLADGLERAVKDPVAREIVGRMRLIHGDSRKMCVEYDTLAPPEIILLDPMFPVRGKKARVKKELQFLQRLLGQEADGDELLSPSLALAQRRVVVKRPRSAPCLAGQQPSFSQEGRTCRYDIYLKN